MLAKIRSLPLSGAVRARPAYLQARWIGEAASARETEEAPVSPPVTTSEADSASSAPQKGETGSQSSLTETTDTATGYAWLHKAIQDAKKAKADAAAGSAIQVPDDAAEPPRAPLYPPPGYNANKSVGKTGEIESRAKEVGGAHKQAESIDERSRNQIRRDGEVARRREAQASKPQSEKRRGEDGKEPQAELVERLKGLVQKSSKPSRGPGQPKPLPKPSPVLQIVSTQSHRAPSRSSPTPTSTTSNPPFETNPAPKPKSKKKGRNTKVRERQTDEERRSLKPPRIMDLGGGRIEVTQGGITFIDFIKEHTKGRQSTPSSSDLSEPSASTATTTSTTKSIDTDRPGDIHVPNRWLRDNCQCPQCIQPSTGQKLRRSGDFGEAQSITATPSDRIKMTEEAAGAQGLRKKTVRVGRADEVELGYGAVEVEAKGEGGREEGLIIDWDHSEIRQMQVKLDPGDVDVKLALEAIPLPSHRTFIPITFLKTHLQTRGIHARALPISTTLWNAKQIRASPTLHIQYDDFLHSEETLHAALAQLGVYGLVILKGVPTERTSNQECELRKAMNRIGEIRDTFYGETWDVQARKDSKNVAYTNVDLGLHQDLLYFESPPRFQALHCLRNKVEGGSSYFVDSFKAAEILFKNAPQHYIRLATNDVPFHYDNDGYYYYNRHKTIESNDPAYSELGKNGPSIGWHDAGRIPTSKTPRLHAINYSPPFQAPWNVYNPTDGPLANSMHVFEQILDSDALRYEFTMEEGDLALFDNRRVLHARREFRDKSENTSGLAEGEPTRWLKGCYLDGDVIWNKQRFLSRKVLEGQLQPLDAWKGHLRRRLLLPDTEVDQGRSLPKTEGSSQAASSS